MKRKCEWKERKKLKWRPGNGEVMKLEKGWRWRDEGGDGATVKSWRKMDIEIQR